MHVVEVRVKTRDELDAWLKKNIQPDQEEMGWIHVVCPDKTAKESSVVSELRARGWKVRMQEWDHDSECDPRAMAYWLGCDLPTIIGTLELAMEESEDLANDKRLQLALRAARRANEWCEKLRKNLDE